MNPDTQLNHYRIVAPLGEGGMGQVYRAEDTRLKRQVAIKVLPAEVAADPERLARLEREAQLLAQLEHPNVAAVYGLEESDGTRFLVMQLVEGGTLADRTADGAIAVASAMSIALQIAEGLEAAHERGIIHRDLKPANVMVNDAGAVKILDFGLAKAGDVSASGIGSAPELTASPTMMAPTQAGVILGTASYMSPEQARGKAVDKRTDIWSFGCVLYEMLTGTQGFGEGAGAAPARRRRSTRCPAAGDRGPVRRAGCVVTVSAQVDADAKPAVDRGGRGGRRRADDPGPQRPAAGRVVASGASSRALRARSPRGA